MKHFLALLLFFLGASSIAPAVEIHVSAAASLTEALKEVAAAYQAKTSVKLAFNFGASSLLARQIEEGAPSDLFISADEEKMDQLKKKNLLKSGTRKSLLSNALVIVTAKDRSTIVASPTDLLRFKRIAIAEPNTVPAGIYARKFLEKAGLWENLSGKIIPTENVRAALSAVESGNAEAGIVYKTDAAIARNVKLSYEVPLEDSPKISYPFAVLANSRQSEAATKFLDFLASEQALKVFAKHGFIINK